MFQLYVMFGNANESWDVESPAAQQVLAEHVSYLRTLERDGIMFMGGPFRASDYDWNGSGMIMVRARDIVEARAIAERDPLYLGGFRTYEVRGWQLNEGALSFTLHLDANRIDIH
ncbi:YCII-related domain protein [Kutzneria sp. CA-103260]|nr:YCII-related domain protein [Kutzneria sp. CA-103260]